MSAILLAILNVSELGDNIVSGDNLYGGTYELFNYSLPRLGRTVTFVDSEKPEEFKAAINEKTKALYVESLGNPKLDVPDFEVLAKIAHDAGIPLIVDNTATVGLVKPIDYGADISVLSATKYIGAVSYTHLLLDSFYSKLFGLQISSVIFFESLLASATMVNMGGLPGA